MKTEYNKLGTKIIGAAIEVHSELGPGLLESVYEECLYEELVSRGLKVERQVQLPIVYKGKNLNKNFFIDLIIEDMIIIELKAVEEILPVHSIQLLTYMKLSKKKLGYLLNFNVSMMRSGIQRKINGQL